MRGSAAPFCCKLYPMAFWIVFLAELEAQDSAAVCEVDHLVAFGKSRSLDQVGLADLTRYGAGGAYQKGYVVLLKESQVVVC